MGRVHTPRRWAGVTVAALAAVAATASPAAAAGSVTTVTASPAAVVAGGSVQLTATVTCPSNPGGGLGVTFFDGGDVLDTVPVSTAGRAQYAVSFTAPGSHTITAAYNGNGACDASSGSTRVLVLPSSSGPGSGACPCACGGLIGSVISGLADVLGRGCHHLPGPAVA